VTILNTPKLSLHEDFYIIVIPQKRYDKSEYYKCDIYNSIFSFSKVLRREEQLAEIDNISKLLYL